VSRASDKSVSDVFISYRRADSDFPAHAIYDALNDAFPNRIFFDVDKISPGSNFAEVLKEVLQTCTVVIPVIGPHWLHAADKEGRLRLHDPDDWVRIELQVALSRKDASVFPVLLGGTEMPGELQLPGPLRAIARHQAVWITPKTFKTEIDELIRKLVPILNTADGRRASRVNTDELLAGEAFSDGHHLPRMIIIPPGRFVMGSLATERGRTPREGPRRLVTVAPRFAVSEHPVTIYEWNTAIANGFLGFDAITAPSAPLTEAQRRYREKPNRIPHNNLRVDPVRILINAGPELLRTRIYPAIGITWDAARAYCLWLSRRTGRTYRLLSEAEWEYCCRAGTTTPFATGPLIDFEEAHFNRRFMHRQQWPPNDLEWPEDRPRPVMDSFTNAFGICGMHGNVWEWVEDCYHDSYRKAPLSSRPWIDDSPSPIKIVRGGCYASGIRHLRSANRGKAPCDAPPSPKFGLRIACDL
jgi:formylglycine-generating enzyme required for sulfatase activity